MQSAGGLGGSGLREPGAARPLHPREEVEAGRAEAEMRRAMGADFRRADRDDDTLRPEEDFIGGVLIKVAARAAVRPDL